MKTIVLLSLIAILSPRINCQQIGELDLGRQLDDHAETREVNFMPAGCSAAPAVHGDGVIVDSDPNKRSKLKIELTLPKRTFKRGETVESSILIQNIGTDAVVIPWSLNSNASIRPKDASQFSYEMGWFELKMKGARNIDIPLESQSQSHFLYGSASTPGSSLSMNRGEWIILKLRFLIAENRLSSALAPIKTGNAYVEVTWRQARFDWEASGCSVSTGYFSYGYQEDVKPVKIKVAE